MEQLPTHVATAAEPIPALRGDRFECPDLRNATPIADMLEDLDRFVHDEDGVGYVERFRQHLDAAGIDVSVVVEHDATEHLMAGSRCDAQIRHRSRWIHFLFEHLDQDQERRTLLMRQLRREGRFIDYRPTCPRQMTTTIREFLKYEGRILLNPRGHLTEGGGVPHMVASGTAEEAAACGRAHRAYFEARRRWRSDRQIKRAVRMLGVRTANGWIVLEARP
jgi:hypothetical protein